MNKRIFPILVALGLSRGPAEARKTPDGFIRVDSEQILNDFSGGRAMGISLDFLMGPPGKVFEKATGDGGAGTIVPPLSLTALVSHKREENE